MVRNAKLMNNWAMVDLLGGPPVKIRAGLFDLVLPPKGVLVLAPEASPGGGYSAYKRVR
jgi:hypothetical protein